jgi:tetratricopeptide (TPR) repeat protein
VSGPSESILADIARECDGGRFVTAHGIAEPFGAFESWPGSEALCVAARLVQHLGGNERSRKLALLAYRRDKRSAEARYWVGSQWLEERGPLETLRWLEGYEPPEGTKPHSYASWCWLSSFVWTAFRDFDRADEWLKRAEAAEPDQPYGTSVRIGWLLAQDRYDEALALARQAIAEHPLHRPTVRSLADLLTLHGRNDEALQVLKSAAPELESGSLYWAIAALEQEVGRHAESLESLARAQELSLLLEDEGRQRLAGMRSDALYFTGDEEGAIREAKLAGTGFFQRLAERLATTKDGRRALLDVGFVRQHQLTCVPATLTTLGRFWDVPVDHLEITEKICYDGTPSHSQRAWFRQNGWAMREFTTSWEVVKAVIDRGIPLIVDTVHATSAHAQAVVGYDERRGSLWIRDPFVPSRIEAVAETFFENYRAHGPRGCSPVPGKKGDLLAGLDLPDSNLYALIERLEAALELHDRETAHSVAQELASVAPEHRLNLSARRALAAYDANPFELQRAAEDALAKFPKEPTWTIALLGAMRQTATPHERSARLELLCEERDTHPVFHEMLAAELLDDDREIDRAMRMLRRVARALRDRAQTVGHLARCHWKRREFPRALSLFRLAACLEPTNEGWSQSYFRAAYALGKSEPALAFLEQRAQEYARRASAPSISLFYALECVDKTPAAFAALEAAVTARPGDGELLCFAAEAHARYGELARAEQRLAEAERCSARTAWLRSAASVQSLCGEHERAIELLQEVVAAEPLALDAHADLARRLAASRGKKHAREHVQKTSARFPQNAALLELNAQWQSGENPRDVILALEKLIAVEPASAWARRELALTCCEAGDIPRAKRESALALTVAPNEVSGQLTLARVCEAAGDPEAARNAYRAALELDPDSSLAISNLVADAKNHAECVETLALIETRLAHSVSGDGVGAWFTAARRHVPAAEVLERLLALRERRQDLWTVWLCIAQHLRWMGELDRAIQVAREASERFPLLPAAWLELGRAHGAKQELDAQVEALERAVTIGPSFVMAILALSQALARNGAEDLGLSALDRGLRLNPTDAELVLARAEVLWRLRRRDEAIRALKRAIEVDPSNVDAWHRLRDWDSSEDFEAADLIQELVEQRPWDTQMWLRLAEAQSEKNPDRALTTLDRAIQVDPKNVEAHDLYAVFAARLGHKQVALGACSPKQLPERPFSLRGREAWVLAEFGDLAAAMGSMKRVLADRPDYLWGWQQLADWADRAKDNATALEAAYALTRLEPTSAIVHGYLGDALASADQIEPAKAALRRSLELDPSYAFGLHRYLDLVLSNPPDFALAKQTLERVDRHAPASSVAFYRMKIAAMRNNNRSARKWADRLFTDDEAPDGLIEAARARLAMNDIDLPCQILIDVAMSEAGSPRIAAAWVRASIHAGVLPSSAALARLRRIDPDRAEAALAAVLDHLGGTRQIGKLFWLVIRNLRFMRQRDELWGNVGYALTSADWDLSALLWLFSYENRQPKPWMLLNLACVLRTFGFQQSAAAVSHDALRLAPDWTSASHATFLALDACVAGNYDEARVLAADIAQGKLSLHYERIFTLVTRMIELAEADDPGERAERRRAAFSALNVLFPSPILSALDLAAIQWRRVGRRIGRSSRSFSGYLDGYVPSLIGLAAWVAAAYFIYMTDGWVIVIWLAVGVVVRVVRSG